MNEADDIVLSGIEALNWAREVSKLPDAHFNMAFFPCSLRKNQASATLKTEEGCTWRTQMPDEKVFVAGDNLFLYTDKDGQPRQCYRILIRFMAFPNDGYKMHKIDWLK